MNLQFRNIRSEDVSIVINMMLSLYAEDPGELPMTSEKGLSTLEFFRENTSAGCVRIFECDLAVAGYAIMVNFRSNEFGGNIVIIDEMFVAKEFRGKGIGSRFIDELANELRESSVAIQLEVSPANESALRLYERLGFRRHRNIMLDLLLINNA